MQQTMRQINEDRRDRLLSLSKRLDDIAVEKRPLLLRLENVESEERDLKRECTSLHNLDAATSNCPDEILAMIFEAGMPGHLERGPKAHDFGVIVSHVSQQWRGIALSTPKLWANIQCFQYSPSKRTARKHWRERAAVFLSRSRTCPVNIHIDGRAIGTKNFSQAADFLDLIGGHMGHCCQLRLERVPADIMSVLLESFSRQPVPLLRSIRLNTGQLGPLKFQNPFIPLGPHRLAAVHIAAIDPPSLHFCLSAFSSVTSLRLTVLAISTLGKYDALGDALVNMTALTHLELQLQSVVDWHGQPTVLPNLRFLAVDFESDYPGLSAILKFIHAPSLISLSLTGWNPDEEVPPLDSLVMGGTHFSALRHLIIGSSESDAFPEFRLLAKALPNIERLTFRVEEEEIGDILANITEPSLETRWPKLRSIAMSRVHRNLNAEELDGLCQLIIKLQQAGRPFRQLLYPISGSGLALAGSDHIHKLEELVELGDFRDDWPTPFEWTI